MGDAEAGDPRSVGIPAGLGAASGGGESGAAQPLGGRHADQSVHRGHPGLLWVGDTRRDRALETIHVPLRGGQCNCTKWEATREWTGT